jgi:hypothetical protein
MRTPLVWPGPAPLTPRRCVIEAVPVVGAREPCPCGSGRRYKACHGGRRAERAITTRPFAGLVDEPDWVALREVVPSATAPLRLADPAHADRTVTLATVLPMAWPALVRSDGAILVGLQTPGRTGDVARDLGHAIAAALTAEPGSYVQAARDDSAPRLQEVITADPLEITVHDDFEFWVSGLADPSGQLAEAMEKANAAVVPTVRLQSVAAAYWCRMSERSHLRWVLPEDEDPLLDAMARLHAARELSLGDGTRYVGSFRAHGLLVPVWDLPHDLPAEAIEEPAAALRSRLDEALATARELTSDERRARSGLLSRQLTLR